MFQDPRCFDNCIVVYGAQTGGYKAPKQQTHLFLLQTQIDFLSPYMVLCASIVCALPARISVGLKMWEKFSVIKSH